ncbi:MAG: hypothetical protein ACI837_003463 [Crocinitomicaceae bacterium]
MNFSGYTSIALYFARSSSGWLSEKIPRSRLKIAKGIKKLFSMDDPPRELRMLRTIERIPGSKKRAQFGSLVVW